MDRREFLGGTAALGVPLVGWRPGANLHRSVVTPSRHQLAKLTAMATTFVPASPDSPGASETAAVKTIVDPAYGVNPYITEVVSDLDDWCFVRHGRRRFIELGPAERERALEERMGLRGPLIQSL